MNEFFRDKIKAFLDEDRAWFDATTASVVSPGRVRAKVVARQAGVMAGFGFALECFRIMDPSASGATLVPEGAGFEPGPIAWVEADARALLSAERTALNLLSITCSTATRARKLVNAVQGTGCRVLDTRKTLPGLREFQKYASRVGGAFNHRMALDDMLLIKDNHIAAAGGVRQAVQLAKARWPMRLIEVEVSSMEQLQEAFIAQPHVIMLDNFEPEQAREAVRYIDGWIPLEASGGITPDNAARFAQAGVDFVSSGWMTRGWLDISLEL